MSEDQRVRHLRGQVEQLQQELKLLREDNTYLRSEAHGKSILRDLLAGSELPLYLKQTDSVEILQSQLATYHAETRAQQQDLDETNRKLEISRRNFMQIFDAAPMAYLVLSRRGEILHMNQSARDLELAPHVGRGDVIYQRFADAEASTLRQGVAEAFFTGHASFQINQLRPDNRLMVLNWQLCRTFLSMHAANVCLVTVYDITCSQVDQDDGRVHAALEREVATRTHELEQINSLLQIEIDNHHHMETELVRRHRFLERIIGQLSPMIYVRDLAHRQIEFVNHRCKTVIGRDREWVQSHGVELPMGMLADRPGLAGLVHRYESFLAGDLAGCWSAVITVNLPDGQQAEMHWVERLLEGDDPHRTPQLLGSLCRWVGHDGRHCIVDDHAGECDS